MQRTILATVLFALAAVLATAVSSWVAFDRVRSALHAEFEDRLARVATTAASQLDPALLEEIRLAGEEGAGYLAAQVQLVTLRAATGLAGASLIDGSGVVLVEAGGIEGTEGAPAALDSAAVPALRVALAGAAAVSPPFPRAGRMLRAGFAPVGASAGAAVGAVAVEAEAGYLAVLADLARTLFLVAAISALAIAALAGFILRAARAGALLEQRLSRAENLAAMGRLTATLAHEIKNPLAVIRGSAERLRQQDPETRRMAGFVIEETDRLTRTVARYLQFARGETARGAPGDAIAALEATLALLEGELAARRVTLERGAWIEAAPVELDAESLKQVYLNLLLNALEAMPDGGRIAVDAAARGGRFEIRIADHGPGMAPEVIERLGDPFVTTKARGSGLGLFLTRRLVQTSGGDLEIASEPGRGTTCVVRLPRRRA